MAPGLAPAVMSAWITAGSSLNPPARWSGVLPSGSLGSHRLAALYAGGNVRRRRGPEERASVPARRADSLILRARRSSLAAAATGQHQHQHHGLPHPPSAEDFADWLCGQRDRSRAADANVAACLFAPVASGSGCWRLIHSAAQAHINVN